MSLFDAQQIADIMQQAALQAPQYMPPAPTSWDSGNNTSPFLNEVAARSGVQPYMSMFAPSNYSNVGATYAPPANAAPAPVNTQVQPTVPVTSTPTPAPIASVIKALATQNARPATSSTNRLMLAAKGGLAQATGGQQMHFNGVIDVQGQRVRVVNGIAHFGGEVYFVSDDGKIVIDKDRRFVGLIQNGKFILATPEIINQLKGTGIFHGEQPQGMAPQAPQ